jgi:uncharacterized repeat protein (TIGR03803 family)
MSLRIACAVLVIGVSAPHRAGAASEALVYSFGSGNDGYFPEAGLIQVGEKLYGTTFDGGANGLNGTVYSVTTKGDESVVYSFKGGRDGANPIAPLVYIDHKFYGVTYFGSGTGCNAGFGCGTVFSVTPAGKEKVLHSFAGAGDGNNPSFAGLVYIKGKFYGTTTFGGASNEGTVFEYDRVTGKEKVLHSFTGGTDGEYPEDNLINIAGVLYGTTFEGGNTTNGTIFRITMDGAEKVIYQFQGGASDGANPDAGLLDVGGVLYGTTYYGGGATQCENGCGTVFRLTLSSDHEEMLHAFGGTGDGTNPYSDLGSNFYGTTSSGGANGLGTVFSISRKGTNNEKVVYSFRGGTTDGEEPFGNLLNVKGTLFGTTIMGGANGIGTVFKVVP